MRPAPGKCGGFAYFGLMVMVMVMGVMMAAAGESWHLAQKREKEQELLFAGNQFRQAIKEYYEAAGPQGRRYPANLEDMLRDARYPSMQRYLRKIYRDPVSGSEKWGVIRGAGGGIYGVYSLSEEEPIKKGNFSLADRKFEGKRKYSDWVFMHEPEQQSANSPPEG